MSYSTSPVTAENENSDSLRSRITIDIDGYAPRWQFNAIRAYHSLQRLDACYDVSVTVSSSGYGIHIIGKFNEFLDDDQKDSIRRSLADDPNRVHMDEVRGGMGHTTQVLWTQKEGGTVDDDFTNIYDALDYIEQEGRDDYDRINKIANDGHRGVWEMKGINRVGDAL